MEEGWEFPQADGKVKPDPIGSGRHNTAAAAPLMS